MQGIPIDNNNNCLPGYIERMGYYDGEVLSTFHGTEERCKEGCDFLQDNCSAYQYSRQWASCALIKGNIFPRLKRRYETWFFCTKGNVHCTEF